MTLTECVGYGLTGFGPAISMFALTIAPYPNRVVVMLVSALGWLVSLVLSSVAWFLLSAFGLPLAPGVAVSVLFQEVARVLVLKMLLNVDQVLNLCGAAAAVHHGRAMAALAYSSGLGFGVASGAASLLNVLAEASKLGAPPGLHGVTDTVADNFFLVSALTTSALVVLHTVWSVVSLEALRMRGSFPLLCFAPAVHLIASWTTLFYSGGEQSYPFYVLLALLLISAMVAFSLLNGRLRPLWPVLGLALTGVRRPNFEAALFQYQPQRDVE
ncbi:gamma-secretase subunit Aph-1-like [Haemaphysalis longicornis]